jgi:signal transduction histidine kinase
VLDLMKYPLQLSGFKLEVVIPINELYIRADADALTTGLTNLITNAIKYSPQEKYLGIKTELVENNVLLHLKDKGIGIPEAEHEHIFETFYRSDSGKDQNKGGLGLGLTIVRHMVNAHGGTITVTSAPEDGSTFTLSFPIYKE